MLTVRNFILFGITLLVFGYAVWMNLQKSSDEFQLSTIEQVLSPVNKQLLSQEHFSIDKLIVMIKGMDVQIKTQQALLKQQQVAINKLFVTIEGKATLNVNHPINADTSELSNLEADEDYFSQEIEKLNNEFNNESIDQKWSKVAVDKVSDVLDKVMLAGSAVTQLDCQSTICKIGFHHESEADMQNIMENFMFELGWKSNSFIQTSDNQEGDQETVIYLSRDGYRLPEVF